MSVTALIATIGTCNGALAQPVDPLLGFYALHVES